MAEPDEIIERAGKLRKKVDRAAVEFVEANERYVGNSRARSGDAGLVFPSPAWEEDAREWQGVVEKRQGMESAWREYSDFLEQHRTFLKNVQAP